MAKQKTPTTLDPFTQWAHKSGRIFMIVFTVYMVVMPFIICTVYDCMPSFKMCLPGLISILVIMTPMSIAEIGSYTPILGSSSYLTFASGNLMNLKMPCIINAQKIAKVEQSTVEGDAIALIATAVSSSVTIVILALGMLLLSFIQPILENETFETASNYLLPALFGAMLAQQFVPNPKIGTVSVILAGGMLLLSKNGLLSFLPGTPTYAVIIVAVFGSILIGRKIKEAELRKANSAK